MVYFCELFYIMYVCWPCMYMRKITYLHKTMYVIIASTNVSCVCHKVNLIGLEHGFAVLGAGGGRVVCPIVISARWVVWRYQNREIFPENITAVVISSSRTAKSSQLSAIKNTNRSCRNKRSLICLLQKLKLIEGWEWHHLKSNLLPNIYVRLIPSAVYSHTN